MPASASWSRSIVDMSLADWRRQTSGQLDGVFLSVKYGIPLMRKSGGGSIVMTSSIAGCAGSATLAGYCATKGGCAFIRQGCRGGVRVAARRQPGQQPVIGIIDTPIWEKIRPVRGRRAQCTDRRREMGRRGRRSPGRQAAGHANGVLFPRLGSGELHTGTECHRRAASPAARSPAAGRSP